jgi:hypothetical protein
MIATADQPDPGSSSAARQDPTTPFPPAHEALITDTFRSATSVALEALEERVEVYRLLLSDRTLNGLTDPGAVQRKLARDEGAAQALRAARRRWTPGSGEAIAADGAPPTA